MARHQIWDKGKLILDEEQKEPEVEPTVEDRIQALEEAKVEHDAKLDAIATAAKVDLSDVSVEAIKEKPEA